MCLSGVRSPPGVVPNSSSEALDRQWDNRFSKPYSPMWSPPPRHPPRRLGHYPGHRRTPLVPPTGLDGPPPRTQAGPPPAKPTTPQRRVTTGAAIEGAQAPRMGPAPPALGPGAAASSYGDWPTADPPAAARQYGRQRLKRPAVRADQRAEGHRARLAAGRIHHASGRLTATRPAEAAKAPGTPRPAAAVAPMATAPIAVPESNAAFHTALAVADRPGPARRKATTSVRFCTAP